MIQDQLSNKALQWSYSVNVLPRAQLSRSHGGGLMDLHFSHMGSRSSCVHLGKGLGLSGALSPCTAPQPGLALRRKSIAHLLGVSPTCSSLLCFWFRDIYFFNYS